MPHALAFAALGDDTRCRIVESLHRQAQPVHELAAGFSISRPAVSRHLRVLRDAGIVAEEKRGRENVYSLRPEPLAEAGRWLGRFWDDRLRRLKALAEGQDSRR